MSARAASASTRLRIAHVVRQYQPSVGGMEDVVRNLARHQRAAGHAPHVVTLNRVFRDRATPLPPAEELDGIPVRRLGFGGSTRYPLCPAVLSTLGDSDVIHVHGIDFFFDFLAATRWLHRRPLVASTHGGFFHTRFAAQLKRLYFDTVTRASARAYARIVATSANDGAMFAPLVAPGQLAVIENGVNVGKFHDRAARAPTRTLIYFGRWSENKGLPATVAFFARLHRRDPAWRLIVAGREFDHDVEAVSAMVAHEGVAGAVRIAPNPDDRTLAELIGEASYFVCLSRHEGFGLAAVEAMSAGLIPVLSDIPPFRKLVEQAGVGLLMSEGDRETALARLHALSAQGDDVHGTRRTRAMAFAARYDWANVAGRYLDTYLNVEISA